MGKRERLSENNLPFQSNQLNKIIIEASLYQTQCEILRLQGSLAAWYLAHILSKYETWHDNSVTRDRMVVIHDALRAWRVGTTPKYIIYRRLPPEKLSHLRSSERWEERSDSLQGMVCQAAWDNLTEYHSVSDVSNRHLFLQVLEAGKSNTKVPDIVVSAESSPPCRYLTPCCVLTWWIGK